MPPMIMLLLGSIISVITLYYVLQIYFILY